MLCSHLNPRPHRHFSMNHSATLLLLDPQIYTIFLSQQFYTEGKSSSTVYTARFPSVLCLRWTEAGQKT